MRSGTSYFNGTLYRKTMARFWPLWTGYGVVWFFLMPLNLLNMYLNTASYMRTQVVGGDVERWRLDEALQFPSFVTPGLYLAAFFAILCAMAVFGYLYNHRSTCWFHALPMRREALFTTQYLAGLSFLLLPQLAAAVLTAMVEVAFLPMALWGKALSALVVWLLAMSGIVMFFFSFAAFCAMFTGHILALPAFYGILNVLANVIYTLVDSLFREFFFGYSGSPDAAKVVSCLSPLSILREASDWWSSSENPHFNSSATLAAYAGVGVLLALASLYVYRRRHAETAGDVVAIPLVRPLFKYGVAFCAGLCLGMFTAAFFGWNGVAALIPCVLVWTVVGYFVAEMLLRKSFRVLKAWRGGAVMAAVMLVLCLVCTMDLFGVAARVPSISQVKELTVYLRMGSPSDGGRSLTIPLTDPEDIQKFMNLHQAIVDDRDRLNSASKTFHSGYDYTGVELWYTLENGSFLNRDYNSLPLYQEDADVEGTVTNLIKQLYEDRELVAQAYNFDSFLADGRLTGAYLYNLNGPEGQLSYDYVYVDDYARELWDAVQQDFAEGNIGVRYLFANDGERYSNTYVTDLNFNVTAYQRPETEGYTVQVSPSGYDVDNTLCITLTPSAKHTLAVLEQTGIFEEGYSLATYEDSENTDPVFPATEIW